MIDENNKYTKMQRDYYNSTADLMAKENHRKHNSNPDYYGILLSEVKNYPDFFKDKTALDFGCGCGRNVKNLIDLALWYRVDGCDISHDNIKRAKDYLIHNGVHGSKFFLHTTDGVSLHPIKDNQYDYVMSTIVLQHICVHEIRLSILKDIYRVLKTDGMFSFQIAKYNRFLSSRQFTDYFENNWDALKTNGKVDVSVDKPDDLIKELDQIGFKNISYDIRPEWDYKNEKYFTNGNEWIFVKCYKG